MFKSPKQNPLTLTVYILLENHLQITLYPNHPNTVKSQSPLSHSPPPLCKYQPIYPLSKTNVGSAASRFRKLNSQTRLSNLHRTRNLFTPLPFFTLTYICIHVAQFTTNSSSRENESAPTSICPLTMVMGVKFRKYLCWQILLYDGRTYTYYIEGILTCVCVCVYIRARCVFSGAKVRASGEDAKERKIDASRERGLCLFFFIFHGTRCR